MKCTLKELESANPKKRATGEKDIAYAFKVGDREIQGFAHNLQTPEAIKLFLTTIEDELEMAGLDKSGVREAFFALKHKGLPKEALEAARG